MGPPQDSARSSRHPEGGWFDGSQREVARGRFRHRGGCRRMGRCRGRPRLGRGLAKWACHHLPPGPQPLRRRLRPGTGLVYFLGGRLADNNTDGSIWSFNPSAGIYADTGLDMPITDLELQHQRAQRQHRHGPTTSSAGGLDGRVVDIASRSTTRPPTPWSNCRPPTTSPARHPRAERPQRGGQQQGLHRRRLRRDGRPMSVQTWVFDPMAASGSRWTRITTPTSPGPGLTSRRGGRRQGLRHRWRLVGRRCAQQRHTVQVLDPAAADPDLDRLGIRCPRQCSSSRAWGFDTGSLYERSQRYDPARRQDHQRLRLLVDGDRRRSTPTRWPPTAGRPSRRS